MLYRFYLIVMTVLQMRKLRLGKLNTLLKVWHLVSMNKVAWRAVPGKRQGQRPGCQFFNTYLQLLEL